MIFIVKEKKFSVNIENNQAKISYLSKDNLIEFNKKLELFCQNHQIEYNHVKLLGILHYVNIAEFYMKTEPEYSKFIFLLSLLIFYKYNFLFLKVNIRKVYRKLYYF